MITELKPVALIRAWQNVRRKMNQGIQCGMPLGMLLCGLAAGPLPGAESRISLSDGLAQSPGPHLTY